MLLVLVYRVVLEIISGISSTTMVECTSIVAPTEYVKDVKFVDDKSLVLALSKQCVSCSIQSSAFSMTDILISLVPPTLSPI